MENNSTQERVNKLSEEIDTKIEKLKTDPSYNINDLMKEIDSEIEEIKSDPNYNEEEGKKQLAKIYDYMEKNPTSKDGISPEGSAILKKIDDRIAELEEKGELR